jgi:anthranilate phosphoribosyltransferase
MNTPTWESITSSLNHSVDLTRAESTWAMNQFMSGEFEQEILKNFLLLMNKKTPTAQEVSGLVDAMMANATKLDITQDAIDIVGTGGDKLGTINISTASALVVAAAGVPVIKHGNRAASSKTGSADVLEAFGLKLDLTPQQVAECFSQNKITFCFAPTFHPAMRHVAAARKELNVPTVFNILGPLANPAQPRAQATGVANQVMAPIMAEVFAGRGTSAIVMRGEDGLDEMSITTDTHIWDARGKKIIESTFELSSLKIKPASLSELAGGLPAENAAILKSALAGESSPAIKDSIALNAAAALVAYQNPEQSFNEAIREAFDNALAVIESGSALTLLEKWVNWTQGV